MSTQPAGVSFALSTAVLWAVSPLFMASAGRRIGSFNVNLLRVALASLVLSGLLLPVYALLHGGLRWPLRAQVGWLALSGLAGMAVGDAFFYEALVRLGPRRAVKMNTLAPVAALVIGWLWLDESFGARAMVGVALVLTAIAYAAFADPGRKDIDAANPTHAHPPREPGRVSLAGLACGGVSAFCIALGTVLARKAFMQPAPLDPVLATTIRVSSAGAMLWMAPLVRGRIPTVAGFLLDKSVRHRILLGTLCGPLGGMLCYVTAIKHAEAGLVSTLVATSPLVIIPLVALRYRVRVPATIVLAAVVATAGVGLIFWK